MDAPRRKRDLGVAIRTFRSFRYRNFRWLWFGAFTSTTGFFVAQTAESWYVYQQTDSEFLLGLVAFLNGLPILTLSLLGGVLADRIDRRYQLIGSQVLQMATAFGLAALFYTGRIEIWHIPLASFLAGLGQAFGGPAYQALIPSLVPRRHMSNAIALLSIQFNLANVVGRPVGGYAFKFFGPAMCFAVNGATFLAVIVSLLAVRLAPVIRPAAQSVYRSLLDGLKAVHSSKALRSLMLLAVVTAFCGVPINLLLPVFARDVYGLDAGGFGTIGAALGAGAVIGALNVARLGDAPRKGRTSLTTQFFLGLTIVAFAFTSQILVGLALLFVYGGAILAVFTMVTALVQLNLSDEMRGRIMSVHNTAFRGVMPLSNVACGYAAERLGAANVLSVNGAVLSLVAAWYLLSRNEVKDL